jgi:transposase
MIPVPSGVKVWIATGVTDLRRGMNGLSLMVQEAFGRDPHAGDLYVFRGRRGHLTTFSIRFAICEDRLSLAPAVWADIAGGPAPTRQGPEVHLHG